VVKPFSPREVVARITAILRRTEERAPPQAAPSLLSHGNLTLDLEGWHARWRQEDVALTATEFGLLRALAAAPGRVFSRDTIIDKLHGPGFAVSDRTIDSHIRNLRAKFASVGGHDVIETRAGIGYRLGTCLGARE
jgi:two-component system OmpR family response regulator